MLSYKLLFVNLVCNAILNEPLSSWFSLRFPLRYFFTVDKVVDRMIGQFDWTVWVDSTDEQSLNKILYRNLFYFFRKNWTFPGNQVR